MLEQLKLLCILIFKLILLILNPVFSIPIIIYIFVYYYKVKKYQKEAYYKITHLSYFNVKHDIGRYGEYLTYKKLIDFEKNGAKFLFNIYIPKKDEETTEIDVMMISRKGIFVFESKNYSGWIFGSDDQKYWYQTLPSGRSKSHKEKFYNPIFQNNTHIKYLKSVIGSQIPFYSIVVFSERCTLKNIKLKTSKVRVINRYNIYNTVSSIYNNVNEDLLSDVQIEEIYHILYPLTQVDVIVKQKHIDSIYNNLNINNIQISNTNDKDIEYAKCDELEDEKKDDLNDNNKSESEVTEKEEFLICPVCGNKLVLRKARHGSNVGKNFYGCSNYPKCKYIRQIEE